jgi:hypothetical protein
VKALVVLLFLVACALFYPFRDLYVKPDAFAERYDLVEKGFWTIEACTKSAYERKARAYKCRKRTLWSGLFTTYRKYGDESQLEGY